MIHEGIPIFLIVNLNRSSKFLLILPVKQE